MALSPHSLRQANDNFGTRPWTAPLTGDLGNALAPVKIPHRGDWPLAIRVRRWRSGQVLSPARSKLRRAEGERIKLDG
jgi:hypothetical protein